MNRCINIPLVYKPLFEPKRNKIISGGRGSAKSESVGRALLAIASNKKERILCTREVQNSIKESVHRLLADIISQEKLPFFNITNDRIINYLTGSEFIFKGLKHNIESIKSMKGITKVWLEEAQSVSEQSLRVLIPTIREPGSEIWATFNRYEENDPIFEIFCVHPDEDTWKIHTTYRDNPFFPEILEKQKEKDKREDYNRYLWIWEGEPISQPADALLSRQEVDMAINREIDAVGGVELGVDVARFGNDRTVVFKRKGFKTIDYKKLDISSLDSVVDLVMSMADKEDCIKVDDTGLGGGVTDYLKRFGYKNVIGVNNGSVASDKDKYPNAISEMWFNFKDIIDVVSIPDIKDLRNELTNRRYKYIRDARRQIESKEEYKKRTGGRSPDYSDAVLLCFYNRSAPTFTAWSM